MPETSHHEKPADRQRSEAPQPRKPHAPPLPAHGEKGGSPDLENLNILLVDDEPELCYLMSRLLQISGHRATTAVDGYDALAKIEKSGGFDLVVMDQNMPGMKGENAVEKIRERGWNTPILITSGDLDILDSPALKQPGVAVIAKPFNMPELLEKAFDLVRTSAGASR